VKPALADDAADAVQALERAAYGTSIEAMIQARAELERLCKANPRSARLHYWMAYADWRVAPRLLEKKKSQAARFVKDGLEHARKAASLDPGLAEAVALESSLLGLSLQLDPSTMMSVGPEIEAHMQRALTMAPENPRVVLLDAIGTLHKPEFGGGGAARALPKFEKAQALFDARTEDDPLAPAWGRFEAYAWAGRSAAKLGDREAARGFYARALEIQPDNGWVKHVLLPELDAPPADALPGAEPAKKAKASSGS
jgi:tetratricopeptide (TPR) repeat protein